jgi:hypothetical protein
MTTMRSTVSGRQRPTFALLAAVLLGTGVICAPAAARTPAAPTAPEAPPPSLAHPAMDFRLVEGAGLFGLTRWIQATGPIRPDTPLRFQEFARAHRIAGLTIVLDSPGGSMTAGLRLGRAFRAAGLNTLVGRTLVRTEGGRIVSTMISHGVGCGSACTYAFIGGVQRLVPTTARFGVHQFSRAIGQDGRFESDTPSIRDFVQAQRRMAELAVYVQEMGVDARLLELASSMPYGGQLRVLAPTEIGNLRIATPVTVNEADRGQIGWSSHARPDQPMLFRRVMRTDAADRRIDEEVSLTCHRDAGQAMLHYRAILARAPDGAPLTIPGITIDLAGTAVPWRSSGAPGQARGTNGSIWISVAVPRAALEEAGRQGVLDIAHDPAATPAGRTGFGEGLGTALTGFLAACDTARAGMAASRQP